MKQFRRSKRVRRAPAIGELPLTPLIDTAFTLLIIFMVTAPMMQNSLKIDLPKTGKVTNSADANRRLMVSIDGSGKVFIDEQPVANNRLAHELAKKVANLPDKTVLVKADKSLTYDRVIQVIDQVGGVEGVHHVALATEFAAQKS